jgi:hypothetical protein
VYTARWRLEILPNDLVDSMENTALEIGDVEALERRMAAAT